MEDRMAKYIQRMYFGMYPCPGARPIFHHGSNGDDTNGGFTPDDPVLTMTQAIALSTAWKGDIIYSRTFGTPAGETWPVVLDKDDVTIVGWYEEANRSTVTTPSGDTATFSLQAHNVSLIGMEIGAGAAHGGVEVGAAAKWSLLVKWCWFGVQQAPQDGIRVDSPYDVPYLTVLDSVFGQGITRDGVRIEGNATRGKIGLPGHGNFFDKVAGIGVDAVSAVQQVGIFDNRFRLPSNTEGKAITLPAASADCFIDGNHANYGKTAMGANPYKDLGAATNTWGLNYKAGTSTMPVTV